MILQYTLCVETETGLVCLPQSVPFVVCLLQDVPFVVGLSTVNLSYRKPKPAEHFVKATVFRDMTKWTSFIRIQWR